MTGVQTCALPISFKFTLLLFVATARKNKFICSSLALIAMLIREALLGAENESCHERLQDAPCQGVRGCKYSSRETPANAGSWLVFRSKSKSFKDKIKQNPLKHRFRGFSFVVGRYRSDTVELLPDIARTSKCPSEYPP